MFRQDSLMQRTLRLSNTVLTLAAFRVAYTTLTKPASAAASESNDNTMGFTEKYAGTAWDRLHTIHTRVEATSSDRGFDGDWASKVRPNLLWCAGLRDERDPAKIGRGYTGHSFNDWNHVDVCAMTGRTTHNENDSRVPGIHARNPLGTGIQTASLPDLGEGGSWTTCMMGCNKNPPQDVCHVQFNACVAFKLVWHPPDFTSFVLVDDDGILLAQGKPTGRLPSLSQRRENFNHVIGSKYSEAAVACAANDSACATSVYSSDDSIDPFDTSEDDDIPMMVNNTNRFESNGTNVGDEVAYTDDGHYNNNTNKMKPPQMKPAREEL